MINVYFDSLGNLTEDGVRDLFQTITGKNESAAIEYLREHSIRYTVGILAAMLFMKQDWTSTEAQIIGRACRKYYPECYPKHAESQTTTEKKG